MATLILPNRTSYIEPKEAFIRLVRGDFGFDITDRLSLIADVNHFKVKEDESVWQQAKNRSANYMEVYWDGVWICDFTEREPMEVVRIRFLQGFLKAYDNDEIGLNTRKEIESAKAQDTIDAEIRRLKNDKIESEEDAIVQQAHIELLEDKKKPAGKKKKLSNLV